MDSSEDIKKRKKSVAEAFGETSGPSPWEKLIGYNEKPDPVKEALKKRMQRPGY